MAVFEWRTDLGGFRKSAIILMTQKPNVTSRTFPKVTFVVSVSSRQKNLSCPIGSHSANARVQWSNV